MAVTTRSLDIPAELDPVLVLGPGDAVMDRIERAFPHVNILIRGNRIILTATNPRGDREAGQVYDLIGELVQAAYQVPMDAEEVGRLLDHRRMGDPSLTGAVIASSGKDQALPHGRHVSAYADSGTDKGHDQSEITDESALGIPVDGADDLQERQSKGAQSDWKGESGIRGERMNQGMEPEADDRHLEPYADDQDRRGHPATLSAARAMRSPLTYSSKGPIRPKTAGQMAYVSSIQTHTITFGIGPAGTGKTYLAVAKAVQAFQAKQVSRIILTRPAVEAGESLGFLPGTLNDKVDPYLRPLYDALSDMLGAERMHHYLSNETIEVAPLAYMRGRTLNDAFVILDEAQNTTRQQMKMFLTRLGFNTKMVITGDITQVDLGLPASGLATIEEILGGIDDIAFVHLEAGDVVRNRLVGRIVRAYDKAAARQQGRPGQE